ncbi:MAG TPA: AAA family ATPase [Allosphingosinicella sp.]|jgi:DNA repair exonuclease SbcCD ATPase subunit|nr:AAA family ATPase [Allosphingosinicella sp.]
MRLKSIAIEGFRAFSSPIEVSLDADVIVLQGSNGVGKTSLLDAILWAVTGRISRFEDRGSPVSIYSREGLARVELTLTGNDGDIVVIRATDGNRPVVRLRQADGELEGAAAEQQLCNLLLPHLADRNEAQAALSGVLTRGVYLQQDLVREFVEDDSPADRFALVSEVVGAGVILELQQSLERSRNQWSRSTGALRREQLDPLTLRAAQIDEQLARLTDDVRAVGVDARQASEAIHGRATALLGAVRLGTPEPPATSSALDRMLKQLGAERSRVERELLTVSDLADEARALSEADPADASRLEALRESEDRLSGELGAAEKAISTEIERLSAERERQVAAADRAGRLATMARLALKELGERCPVCEQAYDADHTRRHLEELIAAASAAAPPPSPDRLAPLNAARADLSRQIEDVRAERRALADRDRVRDRRTAILASRLRDLNVDPEGDVQAQLEERRARSADLLNQVGEIARDAERLSLDVIRLGEIRRREELIRERESLTAQINEIAAQVEDQERTHALAGSVIDGLRDASLAVTQRQIRQLEPLFQKIYSRIDPHPTFRVTQMTASLERGKGRLNLGILDPDAGTDARDAGPLLSSSQLNSYAVALFLAMNLALPTLKLDVTILDDPLQSLDSLNLLGLVDVLRRFRAHRQIIVSTHEDRLVGLLTRKLRPVRADERMITILFEHWTREGPTMRAMLTEFDGGDEPVLAALG